MTSPIKAPKAKLKRDLIATSKQVSDATFLKNTNNAAVAKPSNEIPRPARKPYPQIYDWVNSEPSSVHLHEIKTI
jgi:hypothetical protein